MKNVIFLIGITTIGCSGSAFSQNQFENEYDGGKFISDLEQNDYEEINNIPEEKIDDKADYDAGIDIKPSIDYDAGEIKYNSEELNNQDSGATQNKVEEVCVSKTCLTIAIESAGNQEIQNIDPCGIAEDGCGNYIDCGACEKPFEVCGESKPLTGTTISSNPIDNVCGGGCTYAQNLLGNGDCANKFGSQYNYYNMCTKEDFTAPAINCQPLNGTPSSVWCCDRAL